VNESFVKRKHSRLHHVSENVEARRVTGNYKYSTKELFKPKLVPTYADEKDN
jgi:hypothetical protein